jgi:hypothetical protein
LFGPAHTWQNDGAGDRGFTGPPGGFVEGPSGPNFRHRGAYRPNRGGRGVRVGRRTPLPRPTPPPVPTADDVAPATPAAALELAGSAPTPALSGAALDTVRALASVKVPVTKQAVSKPRDAASDKGSDKSDGERVSKWAQKKRNCLVTDVVNWVTLWQSVQRSFVIYALSPNILLENAHFFLDRSRWSRYMESAVRS